MNLKKKYYFKGTDRFCVNYQARQCTGRHIWIQQQKLYFQTCLSVRLPASLSWTLCMATNGISRAMVPITHYLVHCCYQYSLFTSQFLWPDWAGMEGPILISTSECHENSSVLADSSTNNLNIKFSCRLSPKVPACTTTSFKSRW